MDFRVPSELDDGLRFLGDAINALSSCIDTSIAEDDELDARGNSDPSSTWVVEFARVEEPMFGLFGGFSVTVDAYRNEIRVLYSRLCDAYRALGYLISNRSRLKDIHSYEERARFETASVMLDVSRGAIMRVETVLSFVRSFALMGINALLLYTEDVYPLCDGSHAVRGKAEQADAQATQFGYLRGGYTREELSCIENSCHALGIDCIPCIQCLGHLEQILQWPAFRDVADSDDCLLCDVPESYELIERLVASTRACFSLASKIHIGCDETESMCSERYRRRTDCVDDRAVIFQRHVKRCAEICRMHGLQPMIWGDMMLKLDTGVATECDVVAWDYYSTSEAYYTDFIDRTRLLCLRAEDAEARLSQSPADSVSNVSSSAANITVATAVWTWSRFWAALPFSISTINACMTACASRSVRRVMCTLWGDDGAECEPFSALPALAFFASHVYGVANVDLSTVTDLLHVIAPHMDVHAYFRAAHLDLPPCLSNASSSVSNVSKWMLWEDPLLMHLQCHFDASTFAQVHDHYAGVADDLDSASIQDPKCRFPALIARCLAMRCRLSMLLTKRAPTHVILTELCNVRTCVDELWRCHRRFWLSYFKPFGLEVIEIRYGTLRTRLLSLQERIEEDGIDSIEELRATRTSIFPHAPSQLPFLHYSRAVTSSRRY